MLPGDKFSCVTQVGSTSPVIISCLVMTGGILPGHWYFNTATVGFSLYFLVEFPVAGREEWCAKGKQSWAVCSRQPCLSREVGSYGLQRALPTSAIHPVILWKTRLGNNVWVLGLTQGWISESPVSRELWLGRDCPWSPGALKQISKARSRDLDGWLLCGRSRRWTALLRWAFELSVLLFAHAVLSSIESLLCQRISARYQISHHLEFAGIFDCFHVHHDNKTSQIPIGVTW